MSTAPALRSLPVTRSFRVLGVRVDAVQIPDVILRMEQWIRLHDGSHYVAVTGMHGVTEAQRDPSFKSVLNAADLVVPDGMPLVWLSRIRGLLLRRRVYGPELMLEFFHATSGRGYRHFFYGGAPGVADRLAAALHSRFGGFVLAGTLSPPFRPLTDREEEEVVQMIRRAAPDVLWVGLSTPKQERWMHRFHRRLGIPVLVGVGAAFDLNAGRVRQAPVWMRENGFEWLYRLLQEPRRLWRRYLISGSQFLFYNLQELSGLRKFD